MHDSPTASLQVGSLLKVNARSLKAKHIIGHLFCRDFFMPPWPWQGRRLRRKARFIEKHKKGPTSLSPTSSSYFPFHLAQSTHFRKNWNIFSLFGGPAKGGHVCFT